MGVIRRTLYDETGPSQPSDSTALVSGSRWGLSLQGSRDEAELDPSSGRPMRWHSHKNQIATRDFTVHLGAEMGPEHPIWTHLRAGDRLGVWMSAQFAGWVTYGQHAEIEVWEC